MNLKKALELRKHKYIKKKRGKSGEWEYKYKEKKAIISTNNIVASTGKALLGVAKRKKSIIKKMDRLPIGSKIKKYILQDLNGNKVWIHESGSKGLSHGDMLIQYTTDIEKLIKEKINLI